MKQIVVYVILSIVLLTYTKFSQSIWCTGSSSCSNFYYIGSYLCLLMICFIAATVSKPRISIKDFFKTKKNQNKTLLILLLSFYIGLLLAIIGSSFLFMSKDFILLQKQIAINEGFMLIISAPLAILLEELLFRRIICVTLHKHYSFKVSIWISAILFYGVHLGSSGSGIPSPLILIMGWLCGYVMLKFNNLLYSIAMHLGFNLVGFLSMFYLSDIMMKYGEYNDSVFYTNYNLPIMGSSIFLTIILFKGLKKLSDKSIY